MEGEIKDFGGKKMLIYQQFGIEVFYMWSQIRWIFFLFPYWDDNRKTITYFAFDSIDQKITYEELLKISWIGSKTAFQIVQLPKEQFERALKDLDLKFFQNIPWIGPKTAKKILLELKDSFTIEDVTQLDIDQKLYKNIISSLRNFGYEINNIKQVLQQYKGKITKKNMGEVIKWVIGNM